MSAKQDWDNIPGFDRRKEEYLPLDLDDWLAKYRVTAEAEKLGRANKPSADEPGLDAMEMKIKDWINRRGRICRQNVGGHLADLERELADLENDERLAIREQQVTQCVNEAEIALDDKVRAIRDDLSDGVNDLRRGSEDFERFRQQSQLTRLPDYRHRRWAGWIIGSCFLIEVVLNASLLMDVNAFGLLGSTMQMSLISAVNVIFAGLAMSVALRQRNHIWRRRQFLAWVLMALLTAAVVVFNLAVGHFRDSMQAIVNDPSADVLALGNDALQRMMAGPFDLGGFQTAMLVLLGILCFGVGAWKWYQRDDPYPEYGRRDRQLNDLKAGFAKSCRGAAEELREETYQRHRSLLEDMLQRLEIRQSKWQEIRRRGDALVKDYPLYLGQYQRDLDSLLAAYRSANRNVRTLPAPAHFDDTVPVDDAILVPPSFNPREAISVKGVGDSVHSAITKLQQAYQKATAKIPTLETVVREGVDAFRAEGGALPASSKD